MTRERNTIRFSRQQIENLRRVLKDLGFTRISIHKTRKSGHYSTTAIVCGRWATVFGYGNVVDILHAMQRIKSDYQKENERWSKKRA